METAKSVVSGAEAKLRQAEADFKRQAELMAEQNTAASVYDRALAQLDMARTELQSAQADERAAEINLGYTKVTAPIDGVVTRSGEFLAGRARRFRFRTSNGVGHRRAVRPYLRDFRRQRAGGAANSR